MQWHGLADGVDLLELGCGPGWSTQQFAKALPAARITCIEIDVGFVEHAKALLAADEERVTIKQGLAQRTGLPSGAFDFVTTRFLLQHLRRPSLVVREAWRVLRPGGALAIVETDDMIGGVMDPLLPSLQPLNLRFSARQAPQPPPPFCGGGAPSPCFCADTAARPLAPPPPANPRRLVEQAHKGGSRFVGRHLLRMLKPLGFESLHLEASLAASDEFDEGAAVFAPHFDVARFQVLLDDGRPRRLSVASALFKGAFHWPLHAAASAHAAPAHPEMKRGRHFTSPTAHGASPLLFDRQLSVAEFEQARTAMQTFLADPTAIAMMVRAAREGGERTPWLAA